jgi:hypothetical protein
LFSITSGLESPKDLFIWAQNLLSFYSGRFRVRRAPSPDQKSSIAFRRLSRLGGRVRLTRRILGEVLPFDGLLKDSQSRTSPYRTSKLLARPSHQLSAASQDPHRTRSHSRSLPRARATIRCSLHRCKPAALALLRNFF